MTHPMSEMLRSKFQYRSESFALTALKVADELDRLHAITAWQPIETAPHGTKVLVFDPTAFGGTFIAKRVTHEIGVGFVTTVWATGLASGHGESSNVYPSHWMPLPTPPEQTP